MTASTVQPVTTGALWAELTAVLGRRSDAKWIVLHVTGRSAASLNASLEDALAAPVVSEARRLAERRLAGEPLQYLIGGWGFRQLELRLDRRVLIPRPETEQVAGAALELLCGLDPGGRRPVVADLGTGSGAIALSLVVESPVPLEVWASDISEDALASAEENLSRLRSRVRPGSEVYLAAGSWFEALPARLCGGLDLVVSNPPYVGRLQWERLEPVVRDHEPYRALVPGESGTEAIEVVVAGAARWLAPGGWLVMEIGDDQGAHAGAAGHRAGLSDVVVRPDLAGRDRILVARRPGGPAPGPCLSGSAPAPRRP